MHVLYINNQLVYAATDVVRFANAIKKLASVVNARIGFITSSPKE